MSNREFFIARRKAEYPASLRVLQALPEGQLDYRPHERSPSARQLAFTISAEIGSALQAAREYATHFPTQEPPPLAQMIANFERDCAALVDRVGAMSDEEWKRPAKLSAGGRVVMEQPVGDFLWMLHFDAIHHRGQLAAYLRPMGGRVPAIYGPSADDKGR
jgi:uncharacterized damage-inducible protein DinB